MDYYAIGQGLSESFAKTLFMDRSSHNLNGLCKDIFNRNFVKELIRQHNESNYTLRALYDKLCYMGVIAFSEEKDNGHYTDRQNISNYMVYNAYNSLTDILRDGYEEREHIPASIKNLYFID